jgi:NAD(P)-dependent dehydrogenase (short-subunit alcohol dehydrogenase family)
VCDEVRRETPGEARFCGADFAALDEVSALAEGVRDDAGELDVLVNNAGTWQDERRLVAATGEGSDGTSAHVEFTVAVNHCAHFLLTAELWDVLLAGEGGRVVTVASGVHRGADFALDALTGPDGPTGQTAYAHSKLANVLFAAELARRAQDIGVTSNSCHPGVVPSTHLARDARGPSSCVWKVLGLVGRLVPFGPVTNEREAARTQYYLASSPEVADVSGAYFADEEPTRPSATARNEGNARRLWEWTAEVVDVDPTFPRRDRPGIHSSSG